MKNNFVGKVVLVTGSTSGIGEATIKLFAEYGASCVVTGRNATKVQKVVAECEKISPYKCKVSSFPQLESSSPKSILNFGSFRLASWCGC